jgi:pyridoxamine 5'-phosphate oxidase family protein
VFTAAELKYLTRQGVLGRLATVGVDGAPHVMPVTFQIGRHGTIVIGGFDLATTKKFRDVEQSGRAAIVVDDVRPPWQPRGIEIRGPAHVRRAPEEAIVLEARHIVAWGLDGPERVSRDVEHGHSDRAVRVEDAVGWP